MKELPIIAIFLSVGVCISLLSQRIETGLIGFLLLYLVWHLSHLFVFSRYLINAHGNLPTKSFGLWQNIFERIKQSQKQQLISKHQLRIFQTELFRFLETINDAAILMDENEFILWSNPAAERLLGVSKIDHAGIEIKRQIKDKILHEKLDQKPTDAFDLLSPVNQSTILSVLIFQPANLGQSVTLLLARDITEVYHTERTRRDFVSNVSHELKTPLTVIKGYVELMSRSPETEKWQKPVKLMQAQIIRMENLIDSLLLLSRIQQDQSSDKDGEVNVAEILIDTVNQAEHIYKNKHPVIELFIDKNLYLHGSKPYLTSVVSNLIFNAVIHNSPQCRIQVSWQLDDHNQAEFIVRDHGEGIPARHINRLTERFYQVQKSRSQSNNENSTGLGLAIVKHALQYHESQLEIKSKPGWGSQFKCVFPESRVIIY